MTPAPGSDEERRNKSLEEARKRSVDNLQRLYAVVMGLAFTEVLRACAKDPAGMSGILLGFVATIVPFFHGMHRHLDDTYVLGWNETSNLTLVVDLGYLLAHSIGFVVLSQVAAEPLKFYPGIALILAVDAVWVVYTYFRTDRTAVGEMVYGRKTDHLWWLRVNIVAALVLMVLSWQPMVPLVGEHFTLATAILVARGVADYALAWKLYFPNR